MVTYRFVLNGSTESFAIWRMAPALQVNHGVLIGHDVYICLNFLWITHAVCIVTVRAVVKE